MRRVAHRVRPRESGLPHPHKAVAPGPRRLGASAEHALNGNTSPSAAGSPPRSLRQRVDLANDDGPGAGCSLRPRRMLPQTSPGPLVRLFTRGRELAGTLIRPEVDILEMGIVATTEAHRRQHPDDGSRLAQQARYPAARIGRSRCVQPETLGLHAGRGGEHPQGSRRGACTNAPTMVCFSPTTRSPADLRRGFLVVRSTAYQGEDDFAGRSPGPRRLGATAQDAQSGAARPRWEHVGRWSPPRSELTSPTTTTTNRRRCYRATAPGAAADGPGRPHTDLEARLERLFTRGRELAGTLIRPEVDIAELGIRYSSPLGAQRCSNVVRAHMLPSCDRGFRHGERHDESRGAGRAQDLPHLLAAVTRVEQLVRQRRPHHSDPWDGCRVSWARRRRRSSWASRTGGAVPDIEHAESARWLKALSMESRLLRWIACSKFGLLPDRFIEAKKPWPENPTFAYWWQTIEDRSSCAWRRSRAQTPPATSRAISTASWCTRAVPPVTSSWQFLDDLATHLRTTTGFTTPFDLKEHFSSTKLLVRTAQQTHWLVPPATQDDLGEGVVLGSFVPRRWGSRRACGWRQPVPERVVRGAVDGPHCAGLARGRERRGPRERGRHAPGGRFRDPERCGQPSDPDRHAGPWGGVPV